MLEFKFERMRKEVGGGANSREMKDENRGKRKKGLGCFSIVVGFKISTDIRWWGVSE